MEDAEMKSIVCDICSKVFKGKNSLYNHKRCGHKLVGRIVCHPCKSFFETETDLGIHNLVSHDTTFFICGRGKCKLQFKTEDELLTHLKEKFETRKPCENCARKFNKGRGKWRHMVFKHKVGQLYICGACHDWYFDSVEGLMEHEQKRNHWQLTLPSTQPHVTLDGHMIFCKVCERKFDLVKTLVQHIRDKHREILKNSEGSKPFKCNLCLKRFRNEVDFKYHMYMYSHHKRSNGLGKADLKIDLKTEIKLEPAVKNEYFEDKLDIKLEENCGDYGEYVKAELTLKDTCKEDIIHYSTGTDYTVKEEGNLEDAKIEIKVEEDLKQMNNKTLMPSSSKESINDDNNNLKKKVQKQTQYLTEPPPYLSLPPSLEYQHLAPSQYPTRFPPQYPTMFPPQYPSIFPHQYPTISPLQCRKNSPPQYPTLSPPSPQYSALSLPQYPTTFPPQYPTIFPPQYPTIPPPQYPTSPPPQYPTSPPSQYPTTPPSQNASMQQYPIMPPFPLQYPVSAQYGYGYQNMSYGLSVNGYEQTQSDLNCWNQLSSWNWHYDNTGKLVRRRTRSESRRWPY